MGERREECRWMRRGVCVMVESVDFVWLVALVLGSPLSATCSGLGTLGTGHQPVRCGGR